MAQDKEQRQDQNSVNIPGGLNTDTSLVNQPQGTTRFVMTGVNETIDGDLGFIANEESNAPCYTLPAGYIPMGKVYIGNEEQAILLANPNGNSAIAIADKNCGLVVIMTDENQDEKLGFSVEHQIDVTFRLRRGCERVLYWVAPKPGIFIIDKEEQFKNQSGAWDISKFNLFKTYKKIPEVTDIEIIDGGGILPPGSYNFSIQYLDEDFNPTEFVTSTETVMIYNAPLTTTYKDIRGATKETGAYLDYSNSNKAIKITIDPNTLDTSFPFYRLAITEANTGSGEISDTKFTAEIATKNNVFTYTGSNYESSGTQAEITMFNQIIEKATSIEQIENRLVLGNVEGKQINFCNLQKYASKITTDLVTRPIVLSSLVDGNPKEPAANYNQVGYMPGEIYSAGIVYIFEDNTLSPVYHIPGKAANVTSSHVYSPGPNVYPMSNVNNSCEDTQYIDNDTCASGDYWGKDFEGNSLNGTVVRHHRFPLRTDLNIPFIEKVEGTSSTSFVKRIQVEITSTNFNKGPEQVPNQLSLPTLCETDTTSPLYDEACTSVYFPPFSLELGYVQDSVPHSFNYSIDPVEWALGYQEPLPSSINKTLVSSTIMGTTITLDPTNFFERKEDGTTTLLTGTTSGGVFTSNVSPKGIVYKISFVESTEDYEDEIVSSQLFGLKFSNIQVPNISDTNGQKVIGYYIVRNERKEAEKTILDSGVLTSTLTNKNFVSHGLLFPALLNTSSVKKDIVSLINPEFKFNNADYTSLTSVIQQGKFTPHKTIKSRTKVQDVLDGSGYVAGKHKDGERDEDGLSLHIKTRDVYTNYIAEDSFTLSGLTDIKEVFYLNALEDKIILDKDDKPVDVFNLACDNKVGVISLNQDFGSSITTSLPYVYLYRANSNPYSNFRLDPYYKENKNPVYFGNNTVSTTEVFNGDSYITSMKYVNSIFYDNRIKQRAGKTSAWNYIAGAILIVVAVVLQLIPGVGTAAGIALASVGAALIGASTALILSGIKQDAWNRAYNQLYKEGLRETITDEYMQNDIVTGYAAGFKKNPSDDEIQWLGDAVNLWFESSVNMSLRHGATDNTPDFINAPANVEQGTSYPENEREYFGIRSVSSTEIPPTNSLDSHMVKKLTKLNAERKGGKEYLGLALAEMYLLNPDYKRRNKQKTFSHLPLEYDCCSDCVEKFPHRFHWSEQAFQEELTDNFRAFLPNNYKDLEGETGAITDIFRMQNNLYVHTEEGLWHCPQSFQERVTSDVISFIGTGEYFSIPPRKIVDDANSSAGNKHKWGRTKTKFGVLFPSHKEKKWYIFDGQNLKPISDNGMFSHFKKEMVFAIDEQSFSTSGVNYSYMNNPSNPIGVGYLSTYDTAKERLIVTKKDFSINLPLDSGFIVCEGGGNPVVITNAQSIINTKATQGWSYVGLEDCALKFKKVTTGTETVTREVTTYHPPVTTTQLLPGCAPYMIRLPFNFSNISPERYEFEWGYYDCNGVRIVTGSGGVDGFTGPEPLVLDTTIEVNSCSNTLFRKTLSPVTFESIIPQELLAGAIYNPVLDCNQVIETTTPGYYTTETVTETVPTNTVVYSTEVGNAVPLDSVLVNNSWTMSYSLKTQNWVGAHPYLPSFYMHSQEKLYSWKSGTSIYKHNIEGSYQTFYGTYYPFIIEYVDNPNPLSSKIYDWVLFQTEAKKFDPVKKEYIDQRNVTFNKALFYNTEQISGVLTMVPKHNDSANYLLEQTKNLSATSGQIPLDRNERDWTVNDMRDLRIDYTKPMFIKNIVDLQSNYYIDKIVNPASIDTNKDWTQLQSFRDKFLVVRLIFDTFADTRLIFNFSAIDKKISER